MLKKNSWVVALALFFMLTSSLLLGADAASEGKALEARPKSVGHHSLPHLALCSPTYDPKQAE